MFRGNRFHGVEMVRYFLNRSQNSTCKSKIIDWIAISKRNTSVLQRIHYGNGKASREWGELWTIHTTHKGCKSRLWKGKCKSLEKDNWQETGQMSWPDCLQTKNQNG